MPNYPVSPGMFIGRIEEVIRLDKHLIQAKASNPTNFLITGERGIGKTSLFLYITLVAKGDFPINGDAITFLVIHLDVDKNTTQLGFIRRVELAMRKELAKTEPAREFLKKAWSFLSRIEAGGIKLNPDECENKDETLIDEFTYSLSDTVKRITGKEPESPFASHYDGLLILIDEVDNSSKELGIGAFLKLIIERLQRLECRNVIIGIAGLPNIRTVLSESHPSSLRLFDEIELQPLTQAEINQVIDRCLEKANEGNEEKITITDEARESLILLSEGYPHFIQQFGFSAFAYDTDNKIEDMDVWRGALGEDGALNLIGDRYYRNDFYNKIQAESYRQVLTIMAEKFNDWITRSEIRKRFKGKEGVLDNALKALRDRKIIIPQEGKPGVYRLQHKGFALWIKLHKVKPKVKTENQEAPEKTNNKK